MKALIIVISIIVLLLLLLLCPLAVSYSYDKSQKLEIKCLFLRFKLLPKPKKSDKSDKNAQKEKNEKPKKKRGFLGQNISEIKEVANNLSFSEILEASVYILKKTCLALKRLCKFVVVKHFVLNVSISDPDFAKAGVKFGRYNAYIYTSLKFFDHFLKFKSMNVSIVPDFTEEKSKFDFDVRFSVPLLFLIIISAAFAINCLKLYSKLKKQTKTEVQEA